MSSKGSVGTSAPRSVNTAKSGTAMSPDGEVTSKRRRDNTDDRGTAKRRRTLADLREKYAAMNKEAALATARVALAKANDLRRAANAKAANNSRRQAALSMAREALAKANNLRRAKAANNLRRAAENAKAAENQRRAAENAKAANNLRRAAENAKAANNLRKVPKTQGTKGPRNTPTRQELIAELKKMGSTTPVSKMKMADLSALLEKEKKTTTPLVSVGRSAQIFEKNKENTVKLIANARIEDDRRPDLLKQARNARDGKKLEEIRTIVKRMTRPVNNKSKNYIACKRLFDVYMSKITDKKRASIIENEKKIVEDMTVYNIAANRGALQKDTLSKSISLEQYMDILVLVWLDGIHDGYVDDYFQDWYEIQVASGIFPGHMKKEVLAACGTFRQGTLKDTILLGYLKSLGTATTLYKLMLSGISTRKGQGLVDVIELDNYSLAELRGAVGQAGPADTKANLLRRLKDGVKKNVIQLGTLRRSAKFELKAQWERTVKEFLVTHFRGRITSGRNVQGIIVPPTDDGRARGILLSVDQEYSARRENSLTELIDNETTTGLITYGQALDPGSTMLPKLITRELTSIMMYNPAGSNAPDITVGKSSFQVGSKYYLTNMDFTLTLGSTPVFRLQLDNEKPLDDGMITFNGNSLKTNQSKGRADKATLQTDKIAKYFGDALQYLIATVITDESFVSAGGRTKRYPYFGTGDSMALLGYSIFGAIAGVKNIRMIIDFAEQSVPTVYCVNLPTGSRLVSSKVAPPSQMGNRARTNTTIQYVNLNNTAGSKRP